MKTVAKVFVHRKAFQMTKGATVREQTIIRLGGQKKIYQPKVGRWRTLLDTSEKKMRSRLFRAWRRGSTLLSLRSGLNGVRFNGERGGGGTQRGKTKKSYLPLPSAEVSGGMFRQSKPRPTHLWPDSSATGQNLLEPVGIKGGSV